MNFHTAYRLPASLLLYERMILGALLQTFASVLGVLVLIVVSQKFLSILGKALEGDVANSTAFLLLGYKIIGVTILLLTPAFFVALLMVFGRLYRDQEITVLAASGVGLFGLYRAIFWLALPLALISGALAFYAMPWAEDQAQRLIQRDQRTADLRSLKAGRFNEFSQGDVVLYAEGFTESGKLKNLFVQQRGATEIAVIVAQSGRLDEDEMGRQFIVAEAGFRYQGIPGQADFVLMRFQEHAVNIPDAQSNRDTKAESTATAELWEMHSGHDLAELQRRLAIPLGVLNFSLLSVPLSRTAPRSGTFGRVVLAGLLYFTYENLNRWSQAMIVKDTLPGWLAATWVQAAVLLVTGIFVVRLLGWRWVIGGANSGRRS